jgi:two-component system, NtrC family, sensor kinase
MIPGAAINVLLVEENEDHIILINNAFLRHAEKYRLTSAKNIFEAKKFVKEADIILTNLSLPDGSGVEFLKDRNIYDNVPVIVLESFVDQETVVKLIKSGVMDYVNKSTEAFETLPEKIEKYIELRDLRMDRKKTSDQQNKLSTAISHSSEAIVITDIKGNIEFVNPAFEKVTGYSSEEVLGKNPSMFKSGQHDKKFYENLWRTILSGKPWKGHFIDRRKDGSVYEEDASISPVFGDGGKIINFVALKRDVSDRINIENQLRHAQKMEGIGTLAAGIAHEINTPLQYLHDNTLFIKDSLSSIFKAFDEAKKIVGSCNMENPAEIEKKFTRMKEIFNNENLNYLTTEIPAAIGENENGIQIVRKIVMAMKNFSHPGMKTMQKADINEAIRSTITITKNVWKYSAEIETGFAEKLPEVTCHIADINQVFLNMITNSCDAIAEKNEKNGNSDTPGKIKVRTYCDEDFVHIEITDDGNGIPQAVIDKIFQPFFTTKQVGKGTGQGLALSYDIIVNKHNGKISVESEPGEGTKFTVSLPIENNENQ